MNSLITEHNNFSDEEIQKVYSVFRQDISHIADIDSIYRYNKPLMLSLVKSNGMVLQYLPYELQNDEKIVKFAIDSKLLSLEFASPSIKDNNMFIEYLFSHLDTLDNTAFMQFLSPRILNDEAFMLKAVKKNGHCLQYLSKELKNNIDIIKTAISTNGFALQHVPLPLRDDKDIAICAVNAHGNALKFVSTRLQNDKEVVHTAIESFPDAIQFAPDIYKDDKELGLFIVSQEAHLLHWLSDRLKNDIDIISSALKHDHTSFPYISEQCRNNFSFIMQCLTVKKISPSIVFKSLGNDIINDFHSMSCLMNAYPELGMAVYCSTELKNNTQFAQILLSIDGNNLQYLSDDIKNNKDFIMLAVSNNSNAIEYVADNFKDDLSLMYFLVSSSKRNKCLKFASDRIKNNKDFIEYATNISPNYLSFASLAINNDCAFLKKLITNNSKIFNFISLEMRNEKEIIKHAIDIDYRLFSNVSLKSKDDIELIIYLTTKCDNDSFIELPPRKRINANNLSFFKVEDSHLKTNKKFIDLRLLTSSPCYKLL